MLKKLQVAAILLCMLSYAAAGTVSIGTVSARGDMRVDNYPVHGNATLFDGSVVETGTGHRGSALEQRHQDHPVLQTPAARSTAIILSCSRAKANWLPPDSFQLQANGMHVTPNEPNSRGVVTIKDGKTSRGRLVEWQLRSLQRARRHVGECASGTDRVVCHARRGEPIRVLRRRPGDL